MKGLRGEERGSENHQLSSPSLFSSLPFSSSSPVSLRPSPFSLIHSYSLHRPPLSFCAFARPLRLAVPHGDAQSPATPSPSLGGSAALRPTTREPLSSLPTASGDGSSEQGRRKATAKSEDGDEDKGRSLRRWPLALLSSRVLPSDFAMSERQPLLHPLAGRDNAAASTSSAEGSTELRDRRRRLAEEESGDTHSASSSTTVFPLPPHFASVSIQQGEGEGDHSSSGGNAPGVRGGSNGPRREERERGGGRGRRKVERTLVPVEKVFHIHTHSHTQAHTYTHALVRFKSTSRCSISAVSVRSLSPFSGCSTHTPSFPPPLS